MASFQTITPLPSSMLKRLEELGFTTMTPIQAQAIPAILEGKEIIAHAKTGSGKTLAFAIPILLKTNTTYAYPQHLIITPTRELAEQIASVFRSLATFMPNLKIATLYGGVGLRSQAESLAKGGADIVIGTPGRLLDHLGKKTLDLSHIQTLVLDEADRMLEMGFYDDIVKIASNTPTKRQTLLFSATYPPTIKTLSHTLLRHPVSIEVDTQQAKEKIEEIVYPTQNKYKTLLALLAHHQPRSLLLFANTKADVTILFEKLLARGDDVVALHGDLDQHARNEAVILFANGSRRIMVATDVASRGLDIEGIDLVINYDLPFDEAVYLHRIGRTGRADATGCAISLYTPGSSKTAYVLERAKEADTNALPTKAPQPFSAPFETLCINGGKKQKLRKGDIVGALCQEAGLTQTKIGTITLTPTRSYVAIKKNAGISFAQTAQSIRIKKKKYKLWVM